MHVVTVIPVRSRVRHGDVAADDAVDHRFDDDHLTSALAYEIQVIAASPVPSAARVGGRGGRLRVEDDSVVSIGRAVVAGVLLEGGADARGSDTLHAAMERDVKFAGLGGCAA